MAIPAKSFDVLKKRTATEINNYTDHISIRYHGVCVAAYFPNDNELVLNTGGWCTNTTKSRLAGGIPVL